MFSVKLCPETESVETVGTFDANCVGVVGVLVSHSEDPSWNNAFEVPLRKVSKAEANAIAATVKPPLDVMLFGGRYCQPTEVTRALFRAVFAGDSVRAEALASALPHLFSHPGAPNPQLIWLNFDRSGNHTDDAPLVSFEKFEDYEDARVLLRRVATSFLGSTITSRLRELRNRVEAGQV